MESLNLIIIIISATLSLSLCGAKGGPSWKDVVARVTLDASAGHVIEIEAARDVTREFEPRLLPGGPCDIVTLLIRRNLTIVSSLHLRI